MTTLKTVMIMVMTIAIMMMMIIILMTVNQTHVVQALANIS